MCMITLYRPKIVSCILILNTFFFAHKKTRNHCAYTLIIIKKFNDKRFKMHFLREQF